MSSSIGSLVIYSKIVPGWRFGGGSSGERDVFKNVEIVWWVFPGAQAKCTRVKELVESIWPRRLTYNLEFCSTLLNRL